MRPRRSRRLRLSSDMARRDRGTPIRGRGTSTATRRPPIAGAVVSGLREARTFAGFAGNVQAPCQNATAAAPAGPTLMPCPGPDPGPPEAASFAGWSARSGRSKIRSIRTARREIPPPAAHLPLRMYQAAAPTSAVLFKGRGDLVSSPSLS